MCPKELLIDIPLLKHEVQFDLNWKIFYTPLLDYNASRTVKCFVIFGFHQEVVERFKGELSMLAEQ